MNASFSTLFPHGFQAATSGRCYAFVVSVRGLSLVFLSM